MKFTANTLALQKAIMPFTELETNLFSAMELNLKSGVLTVSARGGSVKIKSELPVSDCEDGTVAVSFKTFLPSIGIIKSENVTVESKGESLLFSFDDKSVEIDTVNGDVVERIDIENKVPSVELTGKDFKRIVRGTVHCLSDNEERLNLKGVCFSKVVGKLEAAATDGHIIATSSIPYEADFSPFVLYKESLYFAQKYSQNDDTVKIYHDGERSIISFGSLCIEQFTHNLSQTPFPNYQKLFTEFKNKAVISKSDFCDSLRTFANIYTGTVIYKTEISIEKNQLVMKCDSVKATISCSEASENYSGKFSFYQLLNIVVLLDAEKIEIDFGNEKQMIQIKIAGSDSFRALIMALREDA